MAAVRNNAYLKQQQTANKLFKTHSKDKFMFWSITSLLLQVQEAAKKNPGQPPSLQLTLADKMISKAVLENRVTKYEEMQLYLQILLEKGDVAGVISALDSDLGKTIFKVEADRRRLVLKYLVQLGRWPEVLAASKDILVTFQYAVASNVIFTSTKIKINAQGRRLECPHDFAGRMVPSARVAICQRD